MLTFIESPDNSRIRLVRKLASRKGRSAERCFAAEGRNLVTEAIQRGLDIAFVMACRSFYEDDDDAVSRMVREHADAKGLNLCVVSDREFSRLTDAEHGAGILAVVRMGREIPGEELLDSLDPDDNILVLDRIQDPGNMGTMLRTAAAAGYRAVLAMNGTVDIYSPKVLRAAAGAVFSIPVAYVGSAAQLEGLLRRSGRRIAVTDVNGGVPYYEADLCGGTALVIGNEGRGVSPGIAALADVRVTLPMMGNTESLNAAVAAAILMYENIRNRTRQDNGLKTTS